MELHARIVLLSKGLGLGLHAHLHGPMYFNSVLLLLGTNARSTVVNPEFIIMTTNRETEKYRKTYEMTFTLLPSFFSCRCISGRSSRTHQPFESASWSNAGDSASCNSSCSSFTGGISVPGSVPTSLPSHGSSCWHPGQT